MDTEEDPTVVFHRVYPTAIPPMRADKAAMGTMPVMAYRHCEPLRMASAFGWYVFPPEDISLRWDGSDVLVLQDGEWRPLTQTQLPGFSDYWDAHAPEGMQGTAPPFLSHLPVRGFVQIWSGMLCSAREGWSVLIRPLANIRASRHFACFEGLVEADRFKPFPLFVNIQLLATDVVIEIPRIMPLFQVQPLARVTYSETAHRSQERVGLETRSDGPSALSADEWAGYRRTIRVDVPTAAPSPGLYTVATRQRGRHEE
jgi:hypothetical protein